MADKSPLWADFACWPRGVAKPGGVLNLLHLGVTSYPGKEIPEYRLPDKIRVSSASSENDWKGINIGKQKIQSGYYGNFLFYLYKVILF